MCRIVRELDKNGIEGLDQHVDSECAGHSGKSERQPGDGVPSNA